MIKVPEINLSTTVISFLLFFLVSGCEKDSDKTAPSISVEIITQSELCSVGDTIKFNIIISDNNLVKSLTIVPEIPGKNKESQVEEEINEQTVEFEYSYVLSDRQNPDSILRIQFNAIDNDGNESTENIELDVKPVIVHTEVTTDETWHAGIHIIQNKIYLDSVSLTIEPGVEIRFDKDTWLGVNNGSSLMATGDKENNIVFTANTASPYAGFWGGIQFNSNASSNPSINANLEYCIVEYCGSNEYPPTSSAVYIQGGDVSIKNCVISDVNGYGLSTFTLSGDIDSNTFKTCTRHIVRIPFEMLPTLGSGNKFLPSEPWYGIELIGDVFNDVTLENLNVPYFLPSSTSVYAKLSIKPGVVFKFGGISDYYSEFIVYGSINASGTENEKITFMLNEESIKKFWSGIVISNPSAPCTLNYCDISHGGGLLGNIRLDETSDQVTISNCTISNSVGYGIYFDSSSNPILENNTFYDNDNGDFYQ